MLLKTRALDSIAHKIWSEILLQPMQKTAKTIVMPYDNQKWILYNDHIAR